MIYSYSDINKKNKVIKEKFKMLMEYTPKFINVDYNIKNITFTNYLFYKGKPTILVKHSSDYYKYNTLSDFFQEYCRVRCKRFDEKYTPLDFWKYEKKKIINYAMKHFKKVNNYTLGESIYKLLKLCTSFRPTIMVSMIKFYKKKTILDFSSGWGDRLIGAMACDDIIDFYCGVDPNSCLHPNYNKMIEFFNKDKKKYVMIESKFEDAIIPKKNYDMVLTSPPYFNLEVYTKQESQSINKNNSVDLWLNNFLFVALRKSWNLLVKNGKFIIIINDMPQLKNLNESKNTNRQFVKKMLEYIKSFDNCEYLGVISYAEVNRDHIRSPQPMWIFNKI